MPKAEKKIAIYIIESIRDMESLKRLYPDKWEQIDEIEFDIELALIRFARGRDVPIEKLDEEWAKRLAEVLEEPKRKGQWL